MRTCCLFWIQCRSCVEFLANLEYIITQKAFWCSISFSLSSPPIAMCLQYQQHTLINIVCVCINIYTHCTSIGPIYPGSFILFVLIHFLDLSNNFIGQMNHLWWGMKTIFSLNIKIIIKIGKKLEGIEEGKSLIRIYCMRKACLKKKKENRENTFRMYIDLENWQ